MEVSAHSPDPLHKALSVWVLPLIMPMVQAVNTYQQLGAILRGEQPKGLLLPAPRGYVASRSVLASHQSRALCAPSAVWVEC